MALFALWEGSTRSTSGLAATQDSISRLSWINCRGISRIPRLHRGDFAGAGGFPTQGLVINDGSGLDVDNRLTCGLLTDVLDHEGPDSVIGQGLAVSGQRGTLRKRMRGTEVEGKVVAKTGTLTTPPVLALAGFETTRSGETVTFAFIQNGVGSDVSLQDDLALALYEYPQAPALAVLGPKPPTAA